MAPVLISAWLTTLVPKDCRFVWLGLMNSELIALFPIALCLLFILSSVKVGNWPS